MRVMKLGGLSMSDKSIAIEYTVVRHSGFTFSRVFTIQEIEQGVAKAWMNTNYVSPLQLSRRIVVENSDKLS